MRYEVTNKEKVPERIGVLKIDTTTTIVQVYSTTVEKMNRT